MIRKNYKMTFITPCFCSGANPEQPELRASSVRGQLRWWFRALGGSMDAEKRIFGGVAQKKGETNVRSGIMVRTRVVKEGADWALPQFKPTDPESYVWYYAKVSGVDPDAPKFEKDRGGPRWLNEAYFAPGTTWELQIIYRDGSLVSNTAFQNALKCFLVLGGIGLRVTRGLGAFECSSAIYDDEVKQILKAASFSVEERNLHDDTQYAEIGNLIKGTREHMAWKINDDVETLSPMGSSKTRQTSAIYFRPTRIAGQLKLVIFEAPHDRVLGEASRKNPIVGVSPSCIRPPAPRARGSWR